MTTKQNNSTLHRIQVLYGLFTIILLGCLALFVSNVVTTSEHPIFPIIPSQKYALVITNMSPDADRQHTFDVAGLDTQYSASVAVSKFDAQFAAATSEVVADCRIHWVLALQVACCVMMLAIVVLVAIVLVSFYATAKHGRVFPAKSTLLLLIIGLLLVVMSITVDTSTYIERTVALSLLKNTEWQPQHTFIVHFSRIFFGLTIIFLSQIMRIGRELQDEQELTI